MGCKNSVGAACEWSSRSRPEVEATSSSALVHVPQGSTTRSTNRPQPPPRVRLPTPNGGFTVDGSSRDRPCRRIGQTAPMPTTVRAGLATSTPMSSCAALPATRLARPLGERYGAAAVIHAAFVRGSPCRASSFRCALAACATVRRLPMRGRCVPAASQDVASTCSQCEARATGLLLRFIATRGL